MPTSPCPLCGGKVTKDEIFCRSCQQIAKKSSLDNRLKPSPSTTTLPPKLKEIKPVPHPEEEEVHLLNNSLQAGDNKSRKKQLILKLVALVAILVVGGLSISFYKSRELQKEKEFWTLSLDINTTLSYADYLNAYPNGVYSTEAEGKIRELKNEEITSWNELKTSNDIDAYMAYINKYPNTPYSYEIKNKTDALAWKNTLQENTSDAYLAYLENVEVGVYAGNFVVEAKKEYDYLSQMLILEGEEYKQILDRAELIIEGLSKSDTTKLKSYLAERTITIFDIRNLDRKAMVDSIVSIHKKQGNKTNLEVAEKGTSILKDINNTYFVNTSVVKRMKDKSKSGKDTLNVIVKLDADYKLQSIEKVK